MMGGGLAPNSKTKTVVVLGAAYGGNRTAQILAQGVPADWKVILIDRNSHFHHVYAMPRFSVVPGHEYKAFIPYSNVFCAPPNPNHIVLQAHVVAMRPNHVTLSKAFPEHGFKNEIPFDFAVYALGSRLPAPLDLWGSTPDGKPVPADDVRDFETSPVYLGQKPQACRWMSEKQRLIQRAPTILVVGGGALGVQYVTDIKETYPEKEVTLLHSRKQLLNRFDVAMHNEAAKTCQEKGIDLILGERLDMSSIENVTTDRIVVVNKKVVRTDTGRQIAADLLLLCTGQRLNTSVIEGMDPRVINKENGRIHVLRSLQIRPGQTDAAEGRTSYPHIFAVGDVADAFGAIMAGHTAYYQGEVAARNIVRLMNQRESLHKAKDQGVDGDLEDMKSAFEPLEDYNPGPPGIKVSLGITHAVYQVGEEVGTKDDGVEDMHVKIIWPSIGAKADTDEDMRL